MGYLIGALWVALGPVVLSPPGLGVWTELLVVQLVLLAVLSTSSLLWIGERGVVRSRPIWSMLALLAPGVARGRELVLAYDGLVDVRATDLPRLGYWLEFEYVGGRTVEVWVVGVGPEGAVKAIRRRLEEHRRRAPATPTVAQPGVLVPRASAPRCPYCKDTISDDAHRACAVCGTAHHPECLTTYGGCSTHGCANGPQERPMTRAGDGA